MRSISGLAMMLFSSLFIVQCVPSQDITNLDLRIRNLDNRMVRIDQTLDKYEHRTQGDPIEQIRAKQAEMADTLDRLNMEMLQLKGQLDENAHNYRTLQKENETFRSALERKFTDLSDQFVLLADQLNQTSENLKEIQANNKTALDLARTAQARAQAAEQSAREAKEQQRQAPRPTRSGPREIVPVQRKQSPEAKKKGDRGPATTGSGPGK